MWVVRNQVDKRYPKGVVLMKNHFDEAVKHTYLSLNRRGLSIKMYWQLHASVAHLVMPKADVETLLTATVQWSEHQHLLDRVIGSSGIGRHMFAFARAMVVQELVDEVMGKTHGILQSMKRLTSESLNER